MKQVKSVLDLGHSLWKGKRSSGEEAVMPHAVVRISNAQYKEAVASYGKSLPHDILKINGQCYAMGKSAEAYGAIQRRTGAERYTPDYIGVGAMAMMFKMYGAPYIEAEIFVSHPPSHIQYTDSLIDSIFGLDETWVIENGKNTMSVKVNYVRPFDESTGGLMNVMLTQEGTHYKNEALKSSKVICIDIGGGTTDFTVQDNGEIIHLTAHSEPIGINSVIQNFERAFRSRYKNETKGAMSLDPARLRTAISKGVYYGGGTELDAYEEASQARYKLLNEVLNIFQSRYGGAFSYDGILLTGGGSAVMFDSFCDAVQHNNIMLADDIETLHLANVRGGLKLWKLYDAIGIS